MNTPGRFDHKIGLQLTPWQLRRIPFCSGSNLPAIHDNPTFFGRNRARIASMNRVVLTQVCERITAGQVVNRDDFEVLPLLQNAKHEAADTAKSIDANTDSHDETLRLGGKSGDKKDVRLGLIEGRCQGAFPGNSTPGRATAHNLGPPGGA